MTIGSRGTIVKCLSIGCVAIALSVVATAAAALPETFSITQIFSNADGTVQFVVIHDRGSNDCDAGENLWAGLALVSTGSGPLRRYVFPTNLPTCRTSGRDMLIATEGFAALGIVSPDYVIPNGFLQMPGGAVSFAGVSFMQYTALPNDGATALKFDGTPIQNVATNLAGASASVAPGATPVPVTVVEFYNMGLDHYFITWVAQEISDLDTGVHKGWARTGYSFKTYTTAQTGTSPVCRFYIPPALGDSHFFGRGTAECDATGQKNPTFVNEDPAFMQMFLPAAGVCPAGTTEIYRVFSNRSDANHRYMTDKSVRQMMVDKGWLAEGDGPNLVVMCAPE
jgi:hypothetical protein